MDGPNNTTGPLKCQLESLNSKIYVQRDIKIGNTGICTNDMRAPLLRYRAGGVTGICAQEKGIRVRKRRRIS